MPIPKVREHQIFLKWIKLTKQEREREHQPLTFRTFCKVNGVDYGTLRGWARDIRLKDKLQPASTTGNYLEDQDALVDRALIEACEKGNANALTTFYKLRKRLVEKKEETVIHDLPIADRQRISNELFRGLRQTFRRSGGICPLCGFNQTLCDEPRADKEPEHAEDREVAAVAVPA